jgi:16S rRNA (guanine966-N2)-methyltransferase
MELGEQRMRIVAGEFKGRRLVGPKGDTTRPTTDRVREALFSSLSSLLGPRLGGGRALDAFAGSGALGLEALSRGVESVTFVDSDRAALAALDTNIASLGAGSRAFVTAGDVAVLASRGALRGGPFALLLLDPPYRLASSVIAQLLTSLTARDLLEEGAVIVYEHARGLEMEWPAGFGQLGHKRYGSTEIDIARYEKEAGSA